MGLEVGHVWWKDVRLCGCVVGTNFRWPSELAGPTPDSYLLVIGPSDGCETTLVIGPGDFCETMLVIGTDDGCGTVRHKIMRGSTILSETKQVSEPFFCFSV